MPDQPQRSGPANGDPEAEAWESLDDNDELDDAVIAADDTGMLGDEAAITRVISDEKPRPQRG